MRGSSSEMSTSKIDLTKNDIRCEYIVYQRIENKFGVRALRGYFGPLLSKKLKIAFLQFLLIGLLEE